MKHHEATPLGFPRNFIWGVATAAYQVEGAATEDGRGPSIWDTFSHTPGKTFEGHTGDIACDQYHRYLQDIELMKQLGVDSYRFSISWSRIIPHGRGAVNQKGLDYYHMLIDALLAASIKPSVTLYHWDLPQALQDEGGWYNRQTALDFCDYAKICFSNFGSKVPMWITFNEPPCAVYLGHEVGVHAPGLQDGRLSFTAAHHMNLAHGLAVRAYRESGYTGQIGANINPPAPIPATDSELDRQAAQNKLDKEARIFLDPMYGRGYPQRLMERYPDRIIPIQKGDLELIATPTDFLSVNIYFSERIKHDANHPDGIAVVPSDKPKTAMGWDVAPESVTMTLNWLSSEYGNMPLYIAENGCATHDILDPEMRCHDVGRISFINQYLSHALECVKNGIDLRGYFLWSFIDNFEWSYGYGKRFGIVYCDFESQERYPKESFHYYRNLISENRSVMA